MVTRKALKTQVVSVPPRSSGTELHIAVSEIATGLYDATRIMAGSMEFATPLNLCGLRAVLEFAAMNLDEVLFDCPNDVNVYNYIERMALFKDLPENVTLSRARPSLNINVRETLIELTRVGDPDSVEHILEAVQKAAYHEFGRNRVAKACGTAIAAAAENVLDHAQSPVSAFVAAQRYKDGGLELACVDLGLGIPTTLRRRAEYSQLSDIEAIECALKDGVTSSSDGDAGRGAGLADLCKTVRSAGHSTLTIHSGHAYVTVGKSSQMAQVTTPATAVIGTWIAVRLKP